MKNFTVINTLKQYLWLINLAAIAIIVYLCTDIMLTHFGVKFKPATFFLSTKSKDIEVSNHKKPLSYYSVIQNRNIFNSSPVDETSEEETEKIEIIPDIISEETNLRLKLLGTVTWNIEKSRAIIENLNTKKQDIYKIGDNIEGAQIIEIMRNKIILNNRGKIEILASFEKKDKYNRNSRPSKRFNANRGTASGSSIKMIARNRWRIPRKDINKTMSNMNNLMTQAMLRPHFEEGKPAGFRIDRIKQNSMIKQIGLENGDIIKNVNGLDITAPEDAFEAYRQLKNESLIRLSIKRKGKIEEFIYNIR